MAVVKLLEYFNDGYTWIVDIDLEKFFDTVCHDKLIAIIMKTIHDGELVSLIRKYLVSGSWNTTRRQFISFIIQYHVK